MEDKSVWTTWLPIGIASLALVVAIASAGFTGWQVWLNTDRDQREREARWPLFDVQFERVAPRQYKFIIDITNRSDARVTFPRLEVVSPPGDKVRWLRFLTFREDAGIPADNMIKLNITFQFADNSGQQHTVERLVRIY